MDDLRTALIVLGAVFIAVLAIWERRRSSRRTRGNPLPDPLPASVVTSKSRRLEPSIEDFTPASDADANEELEVPTIHPTEHVRIDVHRETAVDIPAAVRTTATQIAAPAHAASAQPAPHAAPVAAAAPAVAREIRWPPAHTERVLSLRVVNIKGEALAGRPLRQALESAGMVHGPQRIYHLVDSQGAVRASAANLVRPGNLEPGQMEQQEFRGLSVFCILPGPVPAPKMLEGLVQLARNVAGRIGAVVQDDHGALLDAERLTQLRRSLLAYAEGPDNGGAP